MTDSARADSRPVSAKARIAALLAGTIIGLLVGISIWPFAVSQAIVIISIGRYDQYSWIEEPQAVIERIKSSDFASAVAARAGLPDLATQLPARQYGGNGALSVRNLRDVNILEVKISAADPQVAQKALTAVVDQLLAEHSARIDPLIQDLESRLKSLDMLTSAAIQSSSAIAKRIGNESQNSDTGSNSTFAVFTRALNDTGLGQLMNSATNLKLVINSVRKSRAISVPTVIAPNSASLYRIIAAGAVAGFLFALLLLQMFPKFFRTNTLNAPVAQSPRV